VLAQFLFAAHDGRNHSTKQGMGTELLPRRGQGKLSKFLKPLENLCLQLPAAAWGTSVATLSPALNPI